MEYLVEWVINVEANSPREAARKALDIQRDPTSTATVFSVTAENGATAQVDLLYSNDGGNDEGTGAAPAAQD